MNPPSKAASDAAESTEADNALLHAVIKEYGACRGFTREGDPIYSGQEAAQLIANYRASATAPLAERIAELEADKRRLEGLWSETTVELLEARKVVSAACAYVNADVCVHPILSRAEAVKVGADKLIDAVSKWTAAQPPCCDSAPASGKPETEGKL